MISQIHPDLNWTKLRRQTKRWGTESVSMAKAMQDDVSQLIYEIRENQAKLERQNEELFKSPDGINITGYPYEQLYRKYWTLFNFSPVAYLVIKDNGLIEELNMVASDLFNTPQSKMVGRRFADFIYRDDQETFYRQMRICLKKADTCDFELKMKTAGGQFVDVRLQLTSIIDNNSGESYFSMALTDISELVHLSTSADFQQRCLELTIRDKNSASLSKHHVQAIKSYLQCDAVGVRIIDADGSIPYLAYEGFNREWIETESIGCLKKKSCLCAMVLNGAADASHPFFTPHGSFYLNGISQFLDSASASETEPFNADPSLRSYESMAMVPIIINDAIGGLIHVADHRENRFPLRIVEALEQVALRLGVVFNRFDLQTSLNSSLSALDNLSKHIVTVQENERQRIAMELHDGSGQNVSVLKMQLRRLRDRLPSDADGSIQLCNQMLIQADTILNELRTIARDLKPSDLNTLGLSTAIRQLFRQYTFRYTVRLDTHIGLLDRIDDPAVQVHLYRIFQEALSNIDKHSRATRLSFDVAPKSEMFRITIKDNGFGFEPDYQLDEMNCRNGTRAGMGLSTMALRCRIIGADFSIQSQPGKGTCLTVSVPCSGKEAEP